MSFCAMRRLSRTAVTWWHNPSTSARLWDDCKTVFPAPTTHSRAERTLFPEPASRRGDVGEGFGDPLDSSTSEEMYLCGR